jgi:hypothetical protein
MYIGQKKVVNMFAIKRTIQVLKGSQKTPIMAILSKDH